MPLAEGIARAHCRDLGQNLREVVTGLLTELDAFYTEHRAYGEQECDT